MISLLFIAKILLFNIRLSITFNVVILFAKLFCKLLLVKLRIETNFLLDPNVTNLPTKEVALY